jgi:voltage-gated potassium channel
VGTAGFIILEQMKFLDALYMTLVTISTLGFKAADQSDPHLAGKIWIMFLIVIGILSAMIATSTVVAMVVEGQMRSILGRRKVNMKIASLADHFIICGYGRMGRLVAADLKLSQAPLVIIDVDSQNTAQAEQDGLLYVLGDATDETILRNAGIERARGLVAALTTDAENVFTALIARDLNKKLLIVARAEKIESEHRLLRAGANKVICPSIIGAKRVANILTRPGMVNFIDFAAKGFELEAEQYRIPPDSKLIGQSLRQANLPRGVGILVVALEHQDGSIAFNPDPDTVLQTDDTMIIIGRIGSMAQLEQQFS